MPSSPFLMLAAVWAVVVGVLLVAQSAGIIARPGDMSELTIVAIASSIFGWGLGEAAARLVKGIGKSGLRAHPQIQTSEPAPIRKSIALRALVGLFVLSCVGYVYFLEQWAVFDLANASIAEAFLALNQEFAANRDNFGGILGRLYVLPVVGLSLTAYLAARTAIGRRIAFLFSLAFILMLVSPRRALLLQGIVLAVFVYQEARPRSRPFLLLALAVISVLIIFALSQMMLAKTDATLGGALAAIVVYVAANIPVMDELLRTSHFEHTHATLNVPFRVLNVVLSANHETELDVPFMYVGAYSNTVPFQYYLLRDSGVLGVTVACIGLGFAAQLASMAAGARKTFGAIWVKGAFAVFILFSFREFTLITYDWVFFFLVALGISLAIHRPYRR